MKRLNSIPFARSTRSRRCRFTTFALSALLLASGGSLIRTRAATAPPGTLLWTTTNNAAILGGMATIGSSGVSYFSTLSTPSTWANVTALNLSGTQPKWTFTVGAGQTNDMYAIPALDAAGAKLYIGSD